MAATTAIESGQHTRTSPQYHGAPRLKVESRVMHNHLEQRVLFAISSATMLDVAQLGILSDASA